MGGISRTVNTMLGGAAKSLGIKYVLGQVRAAAEGNLGPAWLFDMSPRQALGNQADIAPGKTKIGGYKPLRLSVRDPAPNLPNAVGRDLCRATVLAARALRAVCSGAVAVAACYALWIGSGPVGIASTDATRIAFRAVLVPNRTATLPRHVGHVVGMGAEEQVRGVHARWIVAPVQHPSLMLAEGDFSGHAVRQGGSATVTEMPVAATAGTDPRPAGIWPPGTINAGPESVFGGKLWISHAAPPMCSSVRGNGVAGNDAVPPILTPTPACASLHAGRRGSLWG